MPTDKNRNLRRMAKAMASSGAFTSCAEIIVVLSHYPEFDAVSEWFADPLVQTQLTELCEKAQRKRDGSRTEGPEEAN
jgi:hypothetical protein